MEKQPSSLTESIPGNVRKVGAVNMRAVSTIVFDSWTSYTSPSSCKDSREILMGSEMFFSEAFLNAAVCHFREVRVMFSRER